MYFDDRKVDLVFEALHSDKGDLYAELMTASREVTLNLSTMELSTAARPILEPLCTRMCADHEDYKAQIIDRLLSDVVKTGGDGKHHFLYI